MTDQRFDIGIIGGGGAAETLVRELAGSGVTVVVFEDDLVGGECPFYACMPSKTMLRDSRRGTGWKDAVARRVEITAGLDDSGHARELADNGAVLVRSKATIAGPGRIETAGERYTVNDIVLATGAQPIIPDIDGSEDVEDLLWTSDDAMVTDERPGRLTIVGAGVVGVECAFLFAGFGTTVTLVNNADRLVGESPHAIGDILQSSLAAAGVEVCSGVEATSLERRDDEVVTALDDGSSVASDRVLLAVGRRPSTTGLGLESLDLDTEEPLPLDDNGRVRCDGRVWAIGDVAGRGQYTHLANHQARVVADNLVGTRTRRFDDVVVPACMFSDPPYFQVGPSAADLLDDGDIVSVGYDLESFPRAITDDLRHGHLWAAARRSTGCLVAAAGIGPHFDEIVHALVVAVDGAVPVERLAQSMQPFPTIGEILGPIFGDLRLRLAG